MAHDEKADAPLKDVGSRLEETLIAEYLKERGHTHESLQSLPAEEAEEILKQASVYASGKLTEVETRAHLAHDFHHITDTQPD